MATRIRNIPAVVEWSDPSSTPRSFLHLAGPSHPSVQLNLCYDEQEQTAIFKIRVLLDVEKETAHRSGDYLYIWIRPEDVILLVQDPAHHLPDGVSAVLRGPTTCLRLVLSKPACVVAPSGFSFPSQGGPGAQMLSSLSLLTKQTVLTIHMDQHLVPDPGKIQRLCQAFCHGSVKQHPRHNTLHDFYNGRDAIVVQDLTCFAGSEDKSTEPAADRPSSGRVVTSSPPYAEGRQPPPYLFAQQPPKKRRRVTTNEYNTIPSDISGACATFLAQQKTLMETFFSQQAQLGKTLADMGAQVDDMPNQVMTLVDEYASEEVAKFWNNTPCKWDQVIRGIVQQEVEDALEKSLASEMEELKDSIREECLNDLKGDFNKGAFSITFHG